MRVSAVWALDGIANDTGGLGPYNTQVVPLLINALSDTNENLRGAALGTLGVLVLPEPDEVIAALERVAEDENATNGIREVAQQAIDRLRSG